MTAATTWRLQVGSTDKFAIEMSLVADPDDGQGAPADVSASWGEFKIFVEGKNLCEARDSGGILLQGVQWYLFPVLGFFVRNWEPMLHRGRLPRPSRRGTSAAVQMAAIQFPPPSKPHGDDAPDWEEAWWEFFTEHCLASARDGGIFPNIWFRRSGNDIEISWDNESNPAEVPLRFLERTGAALVGAGEFAEVVGGIVSAAVEQLVSRAPTPRVVELGDELGRIGVPDHNRHWLRHTLLLDLRKNVEEAAELLKTLAQSFPSIVPAAVKRSWTPATLPSLVFASMSPNVSPKDALAILGEFENAKAEGGQGTNVPYLATDCPFFEPWRSGYELALLLREKMGYGFDTLNMMDVVGELGLSVRDISLSDPQIRAMSFVDEGVRPTILVNTQSPRTQEKWSRAATLAHELCHLVFDKRIGKMLGIASGPWAPVRFEQRANAFAVMFLIPAPQAGEVFGNATGTLNQRIKVVAHYFGASYRATVEHLSNLDLIERYQRDSLLDDLDEYVL